MLTLNQPTILFDRESHTYTTPDGEIRHGVTSTLIRRAFPDRYAGIPDTVLNKAAERGTHIHQLTELYDTIGIDSDYIELASYRQIIADHGLHNEACEYLVTDGEWYASAIDKVYTTDDGAIVLADIKTTSELDLLSVALQLTIYRRFFCICNPHLADRKIVLAAIWLRGDKSEYRVLQPISDDAIDALIEADRHDTDYDVSLLYGTLPATVKDAEQTIIDIETTLRDLKAKQDELKAGLLRAMEQGDIKTFSTDRIRLTRVLPTTKETFDSTRLKAEHPDIYAHYLKTTTTNSSIRITILLSLPYHY